MDNLSLFRQQSSYRLRQESTKQFCGFHWLKRGSLSSEFSAMSGTCLFGGNAKDANGLLGDVSALFPSFCLGLTLELLPSPNLLVSRL